ncbi:hypothetical protein SCALM49S_07913 [Streptomyces californicus]
MRRGVEEFPDDGALRTFLAMALFNTDEHHEAMRLLLEVTAATSQDPYVQRYRRAIEHYAKDLDETVSRPPAVGRFARVGTASGRVRPVRS